MGKPVNEEDLISFIISGLNPSFNVFITTFNLTTRESPLPYADFESELLNHESLLSNQISNTTTKSPTFASTQINLQIKTTNPASLVTPNPMAHLDTTDHHQCPETILHHSLTRNHPPMSRNTNHPSTL